MRSRNWAERIVQIGNHAPVTVFAAAAKSIAALPTVLESRQLA